MIDWKDDPLHRTPAPKRVTAEIGKFSCFIREQWFSETFEWRIHYKDFHGHRVMVTGEKKTFTEAESEMVAEIDLITGKSTA